MPTKTKEYSLYAPGKLVVTRNEIYSYDPHQAIAGGTVGLILSGPNPEKGYKRHLHVQFTNNITWWVNVDEVEPYI